MRRPRSGREGFVLFKLPCPLPSPGATPANSQPRGQTVRGPHLPSGWEGTGLPAGSRALGSGTLGRRVTAGPQAGRGDPASAATSPRKQRRWRQSPCTCPRPAPRKTRLVFCRQRWEAVTPLLRLPFWGPTAPQGYYPQASPLSRVSPRAGLSQRGFAGLIPPQRSLCKPAKPADLTAAAVGPNPPLSVRSPLMRGQFHWAVSYPEG